MLPHFEDDVTVVPVPCPLEDDGPLPRRNLARLSHASEAACSDHGSAHTAPLPGGARGMLHSQLQKMQLAEVINMLLPADSTSHVARLDSALPGTARSSASNDDAEAAYARGLQEAFRAGAHVPAGLDFSAGLEPATGLRQAHSPEPGGTPHSDAAASGRIEFAPTAFADELRLTFPVGLADAEQQRRHKWLGRATSKQAPALGQAPESWSSPLHKAKAHNHRRTMSHQRTVSAGSDVLSHYAAPVTTEAADYATSSLYFSEKIESQQ